MRELDREGKTLVVEDDPGMQYALRRLAEATGQHVETAATVAEALAKLECCRHILLDLNLPDGLGVSVLERVRAQAMPVRVAVVTGTSDASLLTRVRDLGPDAVFMKPPEPAAIQQWLTT